MKVPFLLSTAGPIPAASEPEVVAGLLLIPAVQDDSNIDPLPHLASHGVNEVTEHVLLGWSANVTILHEEAVLRSVDQFQDRLSVIVGHLQRLNRNGGLLLAPRDVLSGKRRRVNDRS